MMTLAELCSRRDSINRDIGITKEDLIKLEAQLELMNDILDGGS